MSDTLRIAARYCGPPDSGNGGYTAGLLAKALGRSVEVTLRKPPPLEKALDLLMLEERAELRDEATLIAEARPAQLELDVPAAPSFERAAELSTHYVGHRRHHFPTCFVCGPARAQGDGLRIFPGAAETGRVAAPWVPHESLTDSQGLVGSEIIWAALDCAGYFAAGAPDYPVALLGRMTADVIGTVQRGERCTVMGWSLGREGRKLQAGTAVVGADGSVRARARQTWILLAT